VTGRLAAATAALALLLAPAAGAEIQTETADAGTVHAELSYDRTVDPETEIDQYTGFHLRVTNAGATVVDADVPDTEYSAPGRVVDDSSLHAADFDGDGTVEVVVDLYSGGAHCCFESRIYSGSAPAVTQPWRDVGYRFATIGGEQVFLSGDPAFAGAFTSYAASRFPLFVTAWRGDGLVDITRRRSVHTRLVKDAQRWRRDYDTAHGKLSRGHGGLAAKEQARAALAAYAADQGSLGTPEKGLALIASARKAGELSKGQARAMRRVLDQLGYLD
jgi:hypothetical protein